MLGILRAGLVFGVAAIVALLGGLLLTATSGGLSLVGMLLIMLLLGVAAGYTAATTTRAFSGKAVGRGVAAGAIAGSVAMIGSVILGIVLASVAQQRLSVWLQRIDPIIAIPFDPSSFVRGGGVVTGFCLGLVNLFLMVFGGGLGGMLRRR